MSAVARCKYEKGSYFRGNYTSNIVHSLARKRRSVCVPLDVGNADGKGNAYRRGQQATPRNRVVHGEGGELDALFILREPLY